MEKDGEVDLLTVARIGGPLMAVVGGIMVMSFFWIASSSIGSFEPPPFGAFFLGAPLLIAGSAITRWAYVGPASRYVASETAPAIATVARTIASEARRTGIRCAGCHVENAQDAKFCKACSAPFARVCPHCAGRSPGDARFCDDCGKPLVA